MARYIKVDDYKDIESDYLIHGEYGQETRYMQMMDDVIANKGIDIVRCKECKYCVDAGAQRALVCDNSYIDMDIHPDDFCSYGEREGE